MSFDLPDLPYGYDDLEPHMSAETLRLHHGKHHKGYVDGLNEAVRDSALRDLSLEEVTQRTADNEAERGVFNKAAQSWNHAFFWNCMRPEGGGRPSGALNRLIELDFGSFGAFRDAFIQAATGQFGSGWAWLVLDNGALKVTATSNAELPMLKGQQALLTCDVWEHAYYLDYKNDRAGFVETFIDHLVNWEFVASNFANQGEGGSVAGQRYQAAQASFSETADVGALARDAAESLDGEEGAELEEARRSSAQHGG